MDHYLELLRREWSLIRAAPYSFIIVCTAIAALFFFGFRFVYSERIEKWKDDAAYYKDLATRPKSDQTKVPYQTKVDPLPTSPAPLSVKHEPVKPRPTTRIQNAPNGINVGGDNNGTAIVTNSPPQRFLTGAQEAAFSTSLRTLPESERVFVKTVSGNAEAEQYSQAFQNIVVGSGRAGNPLLMLGSFWRPTPVGLHIVSHSEAGPDAAYRNLFVQKLKSESVSVEGNIGDWVPDGQLYVVVGVQN